MRLAHAGNRGRGLLGKPVAIVRLRRRRSDEADQHEGRGLEAGGLVAVGENDGRSRRQRADILELGEFADLERHQRKLLVDRHFLANRRRGEHLPDRVVGVDLAGVLGDLHRDIAGERAARQDHRIAPHVGGAILGVFGRVIGDARGGLDALGLDAVAAGGIGLEGVHDLAIGVGRKLRHQHLDALVLGFESDEGFGADEADQRRHPDPGSRRENRVCGAGGTEGKRAGDEQDSRGQQSNLVHEKSTGFALRPFDGSRSRPCTGRRPFRSARLLAGLPPPATAGGRPGPISR